MSLQRGLSGSALVDSLDMCGFVCDWNFFVKYGAEDFGNCITILDFTIFVEIVGNVPGCAEEIRRRQMDWKAWVVEGLAAPHSWLPICP